MNKKIQSRIFAILIGGGACVLLTTIVWFAFIRISNNEMYVNPEMGAVKKGTHTLALKHSHGGEVFFDHVATIDNKFRFRVLSDLKPKKTSKHLIFFGGSFAWGHGLEDQQTAHYHLHSLLDRYGIYNFAQSGSGPNRALKALDILDLSQVKESDGYATYIYMSDHIGRVLGDLLHMYDMYNDPFYEIDASGKLQYRGTFLEGRPLLTPFLRALSKISWVRENQWTYPRVTSQEAYELFCKVIERLKDKVESKLPETKFFVTKYPGTYMDVRFQSHCFASGRVPLVEFEDSEVQNTREYYFPHDGHPTPKLSRIFAEMMSQKILEMDKRVKK